MTPPPETPRVEQRDREAYANYLRLKNGDQVDEAAIAKLLAGEWDDKHGVQIAALARVASTLALSERVAELEAALRTIQGGGKGGSWSAIVEPLVARFDVAFKLGQSAVHNGEGAAAIAELLRSMASKLDTSCEAACNALNTRSHNDG